MSHDEGYSAFMNWIVKIVLILLAIGAGIGILSALLVFWIF